MMNRLKIEKLEKDIIHHKEYLLNVYPHVEMLLSQISTILDFGITSYDIVKWLELNKLSITIIYEKLEKRKVK